MLVQYDEKMMEHCFYSHVQTVMEEVGAFWQFNFFSA